ncbi:hypothetical protein SISNIDRAFT_497917 [Sistotremastrum niveocremeum HHB9708]|uniref:HIT domain-containing protein n=1 Tax=Sistotremastrum niveocremeum HHB9708 TaxID=1314777 RepID=A0A164P8A7_9AGAM|nr:hypothetical protein SISNIDRAFT_497917 [Sistotremastrum niveocremeum HHB9708]
MSEDFEWSTSEEAQNLSDGTIQQVLSNLATGATHSWELGTRTEALLELQSPSFSVFSSQPIPPPSSLTSSANSSLSTIFNISLTVVNARPNDTADAQPLFAKDTAAGDPCSMGVAVLLSNWTGAQGADFGGAAEQQLRFILEDVPKTSDGAISHRVSELQLWEAERELDGRSDSVYMVPPFLAYYGALTANQSLLEESYNQIKLYRKYLKDSNSSAGGLWQHIVLGPSANDPGHWSTGNAWAAAGMLRVYATILHSQYSNPLKSHREDLGNWVNEIHDGMYAHLDPSSGLFFNYVDNSSTFLDASSTALLASTVYRNALLTGQHRHIPHAEISRKALFGSNSDGSPSHFDSNGWLTPVVNPENTGAEGSKSPEGQAFVIELEAAWSDWVNAGSPGANSGRRSVVVPLGWGWGSLVVGVGSLLMIFCLHSFLAKESKRKHQEMTRRPKAGARCLWTTNEIASLIRTACAVQIWLAFYAFTNDIAIFISIRKSAFESVTVPFHAVRRQVLASRSLVVEASGSGSGLGTLDDKCIFCLIIQGKIPSFKIAETELSLAFLDINPVSEGHTLVIPKHHAITLHDLPDPSLADILPLAKKIAGSLDVKEFNIVQVRLGPLLLIL